MRRYETFVIFDPDLSEEDRLPVIDRIKETITKQGGLLVLVDEWGSRKLAYAIKKKSRGYYVRLDYCGDGPLVNEMERFFRIDDRVLKYLTVQLEEQADVEEIKAEMARVEAEKAQPEPEAAAESADAEAPSAEAEAPETPAEPETETGDTETETAAPEKAEAETATSETPAPETTEPEAAEPEVEPVEQTKEG